MGNAGNSPLTVPDIQLHGSALAHLLKPADFVIYGSNERAQASEGFGEMLEIYTQVFQNVI